ADGACAEAQVQPRAPYDDSEHREDGAGAHRPDDGDRDAVGAHSADHLPPHRVATRCHDARMTGWRTWREVGRTGPAALVPTWPYRVVGRSLRPRAVKRNLHSRSLWGGLSERSSRFRR